MPNLPISGLPGGNPADVNLLAQEVAGIATQKITQLQLSNYIGAKNLSNIESASIARNNLGLGSASILNASSTNNPNEIVVRDPSGNIAVEGITAEGLNSAGVVHTNENGEFSTSLIDNADIASDANIDLSKINTSPIGSGYFEISDGLNTTLTNPMPTYIHIKNAGAGFSLTLPDMTEPDALQASIEGVFYVDNDGNQQCSVRDSSGALIAAVHAGKFFIFKVKRNATPEGEFASEDLTSIVSASSPLSISANGILTIQVANGSQAGYLSSADWNTFNNKQPAGSYLTAPVANASLATMGANTLKGSIAGGAPADLSVSEVLAMLSLNITANRVPYGNGASGLTSSDLFTFDGTYLNTGAGSGIKFGNSTASYTPSVLNYYEEGSFSVNFSGAATISSVTVYFKRLGNSVQLYFETRTAAAAAASAFTTGSNAVPARLRPGSIFNCDGSCWVMDNSSWQDIPGRAIVLNNGSIQISKTNSSGNFTNSGNCGFGNVYLRYFTA